ncbi:hypothetical protein GF361_02095 [Candidatus Woesearchaeota archaeon]|nr:hypothetical protein [Candidatus Woesearchaeota archaeon]
MLEYLRIRKIVKNITSFIVDELKDKGLISLYLAGTVLTKDRTPYSDIDIFGIVSSDFDIRKEEDEINSKLKLKKNSICRGFETRFRGIGIDELEGGKPRGIVSKHIGLNIIIKKFPFYKKIWGKKIDLSKFPVKPIELKEEAKDYIKTIETFMKKFRAGEETFPMQNFSKSVLNLARVEAEKEYGFRFDPSYKKLTKHLAKERDHIAHKAMEFRYKKVTRKEVLDFCNEVEIYIKDLKKRFAEWR